MTNKENQNIPKVPKGKIAVLFSLLLQFVPLYALWLVLSEHYQPFYLISGALICGFIVFFNHEMFADFLPTDRNSMLTMQSAFRTAFNLMKYLPWLVFQIIRDNLLVAYLVIHPKMPIDPRLLSFKTGYHRSASQVILANSITLSPGTMTILLENNHYLIHALIPSSCDNLTSGETQARVAKIFNEAPEKAPKSVCGYTFEEVE